jgi:adenylate kinase
LYVRSDDTEEAIRQRLALYDEKTRPILDYYAESNRLRRVDGTGSPGEVADHIASVVSNHVAAAGESRSVNEDAQN